MTSSRSCRECDSGSTHFHLESNYLGSCEPCNKVTMVCDGGSKVYPTAGYWRMSEKSDIFLRCGEIDICLGGKVGSETSKTGFCVTGRIGALCHYCDTSFGKARDLLPCIDCNKSLIVFLPILGSIAVLSVTFFLFSKAFPIKLVYSVNKSVVQADSLNLHILRVMVYHVQIIDLLGRVRYRWPMALKVVLEIIKSFAPGNFDIFQTDCLAYLVDSPLNSTFWRLLLANLFPLLYASLYVIILALKSCSRSEKN
jgi:hypothetical protein